MDPIWIWLIKAIVFIIVLVIVLNFLAALV